MSIKSERERFYGDRSGDKNEIDVLLRENERLINENLALIRTIEHSPHPVRLVIFKTINNSKFQIMSLTLALAANQQDLGSFGLIDTVTNQPVSGTFANPQASSDTPSVAIASFDKNGNPQAVAIAVGTANLTYSIIATYTNSLGNVVTVTLSVTYAVTITAVVTADGVALVINWGAPTTQQQNPPASA